MDRDIRAGWRALAAVICGSPGQPRRWAGDAACAQIGPELFVSESAADQAAAVRVCRSCPVISECRTDGMAFERRSGAGRARPVGVIGGLTATQRRAAYRAERHQRQAAGSGQGALFELADVSTNDSGENGMRRAA